MAGAVFVPVSLAASADSAGEIASPARNRGICQCCCWGARLGVMPVSPAGLSLPPVPSACASALAGIRWPAEQFALPAQRRWRSGAAGVTLGLQRRGLLAATLTGYGCQQAEPLRLPPAVTPRRRS